MSGRAELAQDRANRRLDQWLWFARFAKSRSVAARLCADGEVVVNGAAVAKAHYAVRAGDVVTVPHGNWRRTVEVVGLGTRRGPVAEAQTLFRETGAARRADVTPTWEPLLADDGSDDQRARSA